MRILLAVMVLVSAGLPDAAEAGAWTLDHGRFLLVSGTTMSGAARRFDGAGNPSDKVRFRKLFVQNWLEYGLTDAVTLFVAPEYVTAESGAAGTGISHIQSASVEAGARILLLSRIGMFSIQGSAKTAGAFDMSVSAGKAYGRQYEMRLLYGHGFHVFGMDGFFDVQGGLRWIKRPRPDEIVADATLGLRPRSATLLMFQSFNMMSRGDVLPPYRPYRLHKLELSVVEQLSRRWALQVGGLMAPAGRNIVKEQGFTLSLWCRF